MTSFTITRTEDGTVIVCDPRTGLSASGRNVVEAVAELWRLLAAKQANLSSSKNRTTIPSVSGVNVPFGGEA